MARSPQLIRGKKAHVAHAFRACYYKMIDKKLKHLMLSLINHDR